MSHASCDTRFSAVRLVIFDLDGTLVDAFVDIWIGVNHALETVGLPPLEFETVKSHVGDGARRLIERCVGPDHAKLTDAAYVAFMDYYSTHPAQTVRVYDGVLETLHRLRAAGLKIAILTNKPEAITRSLCERLGLTNIVDGIWGELQERPAKPAADALLQVAHHFDIPPHACAMVGDGPADHAVARAAGALSIAVTYGQLPVERIKALQPDACIDTLDALISLFKR